MTMIESNNDDREGHLTRLQCRKCLSLSRVATDISLLNQRHFRREVIVNLKVEVQNAICSE